MPKKAAAQVSKLATLAPTVQSENSPGATLSSNQEDFYSDYDQSPAPTQNPMIVMDMNASQQQQQQHHQQQQHEQQQQQQQQQFMQMSEESSKRKREDGSNKAEWGAAGAAAPPRGRRPPSGDDSLRLRSRAIGRPTEILDAATGEMVTESAEQTDDQNVACAGEYFADGGCSISSAPAVCEL
ncbi:hypothetical protein FJT64_006471 [Amphibalanus amphitrite]|uniref:Uncharacterized protein n=1 Tax=Amphibalanus amphitrite TaxID=1232801 RepID=A0A6A4W233_AMPAM|nr:hypothetical protein FJT64_006471 [Amphibalanus amphitrite]